MAKTSPGNGSCFWVEPPEPKTQSRRAPEGFRAAGEGYSRLTLELLDRPGLAVTELGEAGVEGTVVLDGIAVGVEQCGVEITQRAVARLTVVGQANIAAAQVHARVIARENMKGYSQP